MHATRLLTPGMMLAMAFGILLFLIVYRVIFRKK